MPKDTILVKVGVVSIEYSGHRPREIRGPLLNPPQGIFAPLKESRRLVITNVPSPEISGAAEKIITHLYEILHAFKILAVSQNTVLRNEARHQSEGLLFIDTKIADEARRICDLCNGFNCLGRPLAVHMARPHMKYLGVSWDFYKKREWV